MNSSVYLADDTLSPVSRFDKKKSQNVFLIRMYQHFRSFYKNNDHRLRSNYLPWQRKQTTIENTSPVRFGKF